MQGSSRSREAEPFLFDLTAMSVHPIFCNSLPIIV